jgi:hypothetical protein
MENKIEYKISFNPTEEQITEVENWLVEEKKTSDEGFFCNWELIYKSYQKKECAILISNQKVIGFGTWSIFDQTSKLEIIEIHPKFRRKRFGEFIINEIIIELTKQNCFVINADCINEKSEKLLRKLKFEQLSSHELWDAENIKMFKVIIPNLKNSEQKLETGNCIELWDDEPHMKERKQPKWIWNLTLKSNTNILVEPIVIPCIGDWNIRWTKDNKLIKENKVKYFMREEIRFGKFMKLEKLEL